MKKIENGIVFSNDIYRILKGYNALDFKYKFIPSNEFINSIRLDFKNSVKSIFDKVTIVSEDDMMNGLYSIINKEYPHRIFG